MKIITSILFLLFTLPSLAATDSGSGEPVESLELYCSIKASDSGSGDKATDSGSGDKSTDTGTGGEEPYQTYIQCIRRVKGVDSGTG